MENRKSKYIFIVLCIMCVLSIVLSSIRNGAMNPIRNTIGYVLVPFQRGVNRLGSGVYEGIKDRRSLEELREENKELKNEISDLTEDKTRVQQDLMELSRLRGLLDLDKEYMQYDKIAARIIAKDSGRWFQVFRINKGSRDGVRVDQNVLCGGGLVGIVTDVGLNYATVRSIIDDESRVSAMGMQSHDNCIVAGDLSLYENGRLRVTNIDKNSYLKDGDKIVTSNISAKFLPGILIGYLVDVKEDDKHLMKNAYLIPVADFDDISEVLVILDTKDDSFIEEETATDAEEKQ